MRKIYLAFWIVLIVCAIFIWVYFPIISRYRGMKLEEERITKEIAALDAKITALEEERELLINDVEYLEKTIREEFGLVKPGEIIYKFLPKQAELPPANEVSAAASRTLAAPVVSAVAGQSAVMQSKQTTPATQKAQTVQPPAAVKTQPKRS
ncbi:MAG: septum formation initiator family protein [Candidatus Omnitrophica bacterium]|nr:septum formation initiator family protein [Candidatus Omnitrophota bacterium]